MSLNKLPTPADLAKRYELIPKKSLGQNFLFDLNVTRKIVSRCGDLSSTNIIEVGPGPGGLTTAIVENKATSTTVIEYDDRAVEALKEFGDLIKIIKGDALHTDLTEVAPAPRAVIANLPYNISTKLLTNWLEYVDEFQFLTLMFQREVALRIIAEPNTKSYGRLSIISQFLCECQILFDVPPEAFTPAPKVTSSIVMLKPRANRDDVDLNKLSDVTRAAFGQRRKMLRSSLKQIIDSPEKTLTELDINPESRAQELTIEEFCKLAKTI